MSCCTSFYEPWRARSAISKSLLPSHTTCLFLRSLLAASLERVYHPIRLHDRPIKKRRPSQRLNLLRQPPRKRRLSLLETIMDNNTSNNQRDVRYSRQAKTMSSVMRHKVRAKTKLRILLITLTLCSLGPFTCRRPCRARSTSRLNDSSRLL